MADCRNCGGDGWYADHSDACYAKGDCVNGDSCPVQRQCECGGDAMPDGET